MAKWGNSPRLGRQKRRRARIGRHHALPCPTVFCLVGWRSNSSQYFPFSNSSFVLLRLFLILTTPPEKNHQVCRKSAKPRQFFLFNDILVYGTMVQEKKKYIRQHVLPLDDVAVLSLAESDSPLKHAWIVRCALLPFTSSAHPMLLTHQFSGFSPFHVFTKLALFHSAPPFGADLERAQILRGGCHHRRGKDTVDESLVTQQRHTHHARRQR